MAQPQATSTSSSATHCTFYTSQEDHDLMDQVVLYNPFKRGKSWEALRQQLSTHPSLFRLTSKILQDRAHLLMGERKSKVAVQEKASGIEEPPRTDFEVAVDEALHLKMEEEEAAVAIKRGASVSVADQKILEAAGKGQQAKAAVNDAKPAAEAPPAVKAARQAARGGELVELLKIKIEAEKEAREAADTKMDAQKEVERAAAAEDRQLRREELELKRREIELRERQEADASEERRLLIQFLMKK